MLLLISNRERVIHLIINTTLETLFATQLEIPNKVDKTRYPGIFSYLTGGTIPIYIIS